jgi:hypothetical protein
VLTSSLRRAVSMSRRVGDIPDVGCQQSWRRRSASSSRPATTRASCSSSKSSPTSSTGDRRAIPGGVPPLVAVAAEACAAVTAAAGGVVAATTREQMLTDSSRDTRSQTTGGPPEARTRPPISGRPALAERRGARAADGEAYIVDAAGGAEPRTLPRRRRPSRRLPADCIVLDGPPAVLAAAKAAGCVMVNMVGTRQENELEADLARDGLYPLSVDVLPDGSFCLGPAAQLPGAKELRSRSADLERRPDSGARWVRQDPSSARP